jgi:hypothetical protein
VPITVHLTTSVGTPKRVHRTFQAQVNEEDIELQQFDAQKLRDRTDFVARQNQIYDQRLSQGLFGGPGGPGAAILPAKIIRMGKQYTDEQRLNRDQFFREQGIREVIQQGL